MNAKLVFTVEAEVSEDDPCDIEGLDKKDFIGECMKVKSGLHENAIMGWITAVKITKSKKK